jgi:thioredoxin-like negative regulator of GroEL
MSSSNNSNIKFYAYSVITLAGSAFMAAGFVVPQALGYAKSESTRYAVAALNEQGSEAAIDYRLAYALDHSNEAAAVGLSRVYLASSQSREAMQLLGRIGDNADGLRLRLQTLIELGMYAEAKSTADKLAAGKNEGDIVLVAAVYALGGYKSELALLDGRLSSVEALQALSRLNAGQLPEALELQALGLPVSSSTLLMKLAPSTPRSLALGQILLAKGDKDSLAQASDYLSAGIKLDPSDIELRATYADVLRAQKQLEAALAQDKLVLRLKQGRL